MPGHGRKHVPRVSTFRRRPQPWKNLEIAYLTKDQIVQGCRLVEAAGADDVKTPTGFASTGVTIEDLVLMRASVSEKAKIKAAGGVHS